MSLKRQVASGMFWVSLAQVVGQGLVMLVGLVLPKLLTPAQMGLAGMASITISAIELFQDVGLESALVYRRKDVEEASDTVFLSVIVSSVILYLGLFAAAPLVGQFFREPAVVPILRVLALTLPISSVGRVPLVLLGRDLDFRRRIIPELVSSILASVAVVVMAARGLGVWSLVWREIIRQLLAALLVWLVSSYRPRIRFNLRLAREMLSYGQHIVSSQVLIFLITNVDNAAIGRYIGKNALGQYQWAYNLSNRPATMINRVLNQVMFPTFSKLAEGDRSKMGEIRTRYYMTVLHYVTWIIMPITVATILFAGNFIRDLYDPAWAPAIVPLQLLAVYGFIRALAGNMGSVFRAMGKPQWLTYIALWRLLTMLVGLYLVLIPWHLGIMGVAGLSVVVALADFVVSAVLVDRLIAAPLTGYVRMILPAAVAGLAAGFASHWLYPHMPLPRPSFRLLGSGVVLVALYLVLIWAIDARFRGAVAMILRGAGHVWEERIGGRLPSSRSRRNRG